MVLFRFALAATLCLLVTTAVAQVRAPSGSVILTVTGLDPAAFPEGQMQFDQDGLQALGETRITTSSIWTKGTHNYTGLLLSDLADHLHITGRALKLHALNDYSISLPADAATPQGPILAYLMDGQPMAVREKGPIWVIYPYDSDVSLRTDQIYAWSVWQLDRIDVLQ